MCRKIDVEQILKETNEPKKKKDNSPSKRFYSMALLLIVVLLVSGSINYRMNGNIYVGADMDTFSIFENVNILENVNISGNLSVEELTVRSGASITLAGATFSNEELFTSVDTDWGIHLDDEPTAFMAIYAHNGSVQTTANLILEAGNNTFNSVANFVKNSPLHPLSPNSSGIINEGGNFGTFVPHGEDMIWFHFDNLTKDQFGNIQYLGGAERLMTLNDSGLILDVGSFTGSGLMTPNMTGAYGIGVGTLSLIGGSKTTHYGGIGGGGGKISLQGGRGRDAGNDPSSYGSILLQSIGGKVGLGIDSPSSALHIKAGTSGTVGSHPAGQLIIQSPTDSVFANAVITGYESDGSGNPDQQLWYLGSSSSGSSDIILLNRRSANLKLGTGGSTWMTIAGGGNVGIRTATPSTELEVNGIINATGFAVGQIGYTGSCINASYVGGIVVGCND